MKIMAKTIRDLRARRERVTRVVATICGKSTGHICDHDLERYHLGMVKDALLLIFGYILVTTYWVKLMPLYGGFEGRTSLSSVAMLYVHRLPMLAAGLNEVCLGRATHVFLMAGVVLVLTVAQQVIFIRLLFFPKKS